MIDKPLTQLKSFFEKVEELNICGSDQLIYLHLWKEFNQRHYPETLRIKDAVLKDAIRLYDSNGKPVSAETIRRAKQRLKAKGLIDFTTDMGVSVYRLIPLYEVSKPQAADELADEVRHAWIQANGENPFGGYREDLITRQKRYGAKAVSKAIERCRKKRTFGDLISMNFLDSELMKGGEPSGKPIGASRNDARNNVPITSDFSGAWDFADELPPED